MNDCLLLSLLSELLRKRRVTAAELAKKYAVSPRTVYRYVARLATVLPVHVLRGRTGGVCLSDSYRLPSDFLTAEEYDEVVTALHDAYAKRPAESILTARQKITATVKRPKKESLRLNADNVVIFPTERENALAEKLRCAQAALRERKTLRLLFLENGKNTDYAVEPHALVYRKEEWFLCAFCYAWRTFALFPFEQMLGVLRGNERFRPRKFNVNECPIAAVGVIFF